jgi:hypothetical protein
MNASASPFLNLAAVIRALRASVGGWGLLGWLDAALVLLLYRRLGQIGRDMEGLAARFAAGTLRRRPPEGVTRAAVVERRVRRAATARIWPGGFGWLVKAASWHAAGYGSQLRAVLQTPEMVALLEATPQAARVLTPLCRMLAVETSVLRPGVTPRAVKARIRVRTARPKVDWGRIPIPRGVLAAVRRQGVGRRPPPCGSSP